MIIYAVIARATDAAVLVDCCDPLLKGNAALVTSVLLQHLRDHPTLVPDGDLRTYVQRNAANTTTATTTADESNDPALDFFTQFFDSACAMALGDQDDDDGVDENFFHLYRQDQVYYCALSDDPDARHQKVNFAFLHHVQQEFTKLFRQNRILKANAYSLDKIFKPNMRSAMHYYNTHQKDLAREESVQVVLAQVQDLQTVMNRNISLLLERGDNIDALLDKSDSLQHEARVFRRQSRRMLRQQRRKYYLNAFLMLCAVVIFGFLVSLAVCGGGYKYCRQRHQTSGDHQNEWE